MKESNLHFNHNQTNPIMQSKKAFYKSTTFHGLIILVVSLLMIIFNINYAEVVNVFGLIWTLYGRIKADKPLGMVDQ